LPCVDKSPAEVHAGTNGEAQDCAQVSGFCTHPKYAATIVVLCPKTCDKCPPAPLAPPPAPKPEPTTIGQVHAFMTLASSAWDQAVKNCNCPAAESSDPAMAAELVTPGSPAAAKMVTDRIVAILEAEAPPKSDKAKEAKAEVCRTCFTAFAEAQGCPYTRRGNPTMEHMPPACQTCALVEQCPPAPEGQSTEKLPPCPKPEEEPMPPKPVPVVAPPSPPVVGLPPPTVLVPVPATLPLSVTSLTAHLKCQSKATTCPQSCQ